MNTSPLDLMHSTPNGGLAVISGKQDEFDAIPCIHRACEDDKADEYEYPQVTLRIAWEGEEFFIV